MEWAMRKDDKDLAYFGKRAAEEEARTAKAEGPGAQGSHARMGLAYRKKVKDLREHASYTIVPEPD
jgi:UDP-N-acetyl-D-mannosaminuronate dehydrogenase